MKQNYMKPNADRNGIWGIEEATVRCNFKPDAWAYLERLFPGMNTNGPKRTFDMGQTRLSFEQSDSDLTVELKAASNNPGRGIFHIANVTTIA